MTTAPGPASTTLPNGSPRRGRRGPPAGLWTRIRAAFARERHRPASTLPAWFSYMLMLWITLLIGAQIWIGIVVQALVTAQVEDRATLAWVWADNRLLAEENIRLSRNNCVATHTVYDLARGVCDRGSSVEAAIPPLPDLIKKIPAPKKPAGLK